MNMIRTASNEEQAFRRGYVHGYIHAIDDHTNGKTTQQQNRFVDTALADWREGDVNKMVQPPAIEQVPA